MAATAPVFPGQCTERFIVKQKNVSYWYNWREGEIFKWLIVSDLILWHTVGL